MSMLSALQPENILCGEKIYDIKIADFGLSKLVLPDEIMKMPCGTLSYVAPEVRCVACVDNFSDARHI